MRYKQGALRVQSLSVRKFPTFARVYTDVRRTGVGVIADIANPGERGMFVGVMTLGGVVSFRSTTDLIDEEILLT